jgi:hypothetical protein
MSIAISQKLEYELTGNDLNSDPCIFPRDPVNHVFVQAFDFKTKLIASSPTQYLAFPFVIKKGSSLIGIYSDGDSHANSDKQVMIRSDDNGATWSSVDFYVAATGVYNLSLISPLLAAGESVVLKPWTIKNTAGTVAATIASNPISGGVTYFLWSEAVAGPSSKLYRTGYGSNQTALLESSDGGSTWSVTSVMFNGAGLLFSEADIVNLSGTNWLAVCREDAGGAAASSLYINTSTDDGATWATQTLLDNTRTSGRQPNLIKTNDGALILSTGDRRGGTGFSGGGDALYGSALTGTCVHRTPLLACGNNPLTTPTAGQAKMRITLNDHGAETGDIVFINGATGTVDGIATSEVNGFKTVTKISDNVIEVATTTNATAGSVTGGGSAVTVQNLTRWGFRTRISPMYSTDGGQPFANEISNNRINVVYYARRTDRTKPVIASATLNTTNL